MSPDRAARLSAALTELGLAASTEQQQQLLRLLDALMQWNSAFNLTAVRDIDEALTLHLLDSLSLAPHVSGPDLLDVGTGPGFPALPLAILRPDLQVTALDSNGKKIRFIIQIAHELGLKNIHPVQARVETHQGQYAQITSRAFAELQDFLRLTGHLLAPGGEWLAMKSQSATEELKALSEGLQAEVRPLKVPGLAAERCVVRVRKD